MVDVAEIKLWGKLLGAVRWDALEQFASFEFAPTFRHSAWDVSPIKMPLSQANHIFRFPELRAQRSAEFDTFRGLPGLLADVLPDKYGNSIIQAWLSANGRASNSMNPVEQLCFIGQRGMGALEFEPIVLKSQQKSFSIEIESLVAYAQKLLQKREGFQTNLFVQEQKAMNEILRIGTSAGGARPKAVIAFNEKTGEVRSGQASIPKGFSHWMLKLDGVSEAQFGTSFGFGRVEMAYYMMAKAAGIEMMESRLLEENGRAHFMTRRFDRTDDGEKIHMQSLCALRHFDFNQIGAFSYEQLFETMRMLRLPYPQAEQMFRRMAFNILARNCDDHTKNFAFLMDKFGNWSLAPAYDICFAYRPDSYWVSKQSLSMAGKRESFELSDFLQVAKQMNIKRAPSILQEINSALSRWPEFAETTGIKKELSSHIQQNLQHLKEK